MRRMSDSAHQSMAAARTMHNRIKIRRVRPTELRRCFMERSFEKFVTIVTHLKPFAKV